MQAKEVEENESKFDENEEEKREEGEDSGIFEEGVVKKAEDIDVSGKSLELPLLEGVVDGETGEDVEGLYLYKNELNLIPRKVGGMRKLKILKFFANEVNLFPEGGGFKDLVELECLQLKVAGAPGLKGLELGKLKGLRELELSKVPPRPSAFPILSEIAGLKCLTKLSVCHFSIRYLPPEIGFLDNLEYLDLSFNKMRNLPAEITYLNSLTSLRVSNNKLVELPSGLSALPRLENLDLSNNKLTSLGNLELGLMHNLQRLNLQFNRLRTYCQIPSWICCYLEGNGKDISNDEFISSGSSVEMDVLEDGVDETRVSPQYGLSITSSSHLSGPSSNNRCFAARRSKGWKRRHYLQQRARQERLNSRRWRSENHASKLGASGRCKCRPNVNDSVAEDSSSVACSKVISTELLSDGVECGEALVNIEEENGSSKKDGCVEKCLCDESDPLGMHKEDKDGCSQCDESLGSLEYAAATPNEGSSPELLTSSSKAKRHFDGDLDNPKPSKYRRPTDNSNLSSQYSKISICGADDHLADGFYDAGRDRPFMSLQEYEQNLPLDSREVILVDREKDEGLDAITCRAQALVSFFKQMSGSTKRRGHATIDYLQIASLLALLVSDHFGGSDKSAVIQQTRKVVSGSNYRRPFVCTCATGNADSLSEDAKWSLNNVDEFAFRDLCESSLHSIKARRNSIVVPIGSLQFGICRHRALLLKYLCDRMEPQIPCELVRGFLDFSPHAWNVIVVKRNQSWVRMIVDACHPHDIREETDREYFCRYIPLSRMNVSVPEGNTGPGSSFPSIPSGDRKGKTASTTLVRCESGSLEAAAKVRTLEVCNASRDEIRNFELTCLGEVRMLSVLKHPCIVELYGHQISSGWARSSDGKLEPRILQSTILMDYVKGGSIKNYLEELSRVGDKRVPTPLALYIARDIACALRELHSRHIIHRDIKSENILIDLDKKRADGTPVVKLCDFDRAVPLRSYLHNCCIAHRGIPPADVCVGTPRWMAPEVFSTMHNQDLYGLEVDIWSFGCFLLELLTLQVPYAGLPETGMHNFLQTGRRPPLTEELEGLVQPDEELDSLASSSESSSTTDVDGPDTGSDASLRFLVNLYHRCTQKNPADRPTAERLYGLLLTHSSSVSTIESKEE